MPAEPVAQLQTVDACLAAARGEIPAEEQERLARVARVLGVDEGERPNKRGMSTEAAEDPMKNKREKYARLIAFAKTLPPTPTAVAHPCDESSLRGAVEAAQLGLIQPILVGPTDEERMISSHTLDLVEI
ncbi:hypothetical protein WK27_05460 [Burkholderia vietnamiensis]|nr:hypothetical protein WK27_05460 [Burkholderia vietnamiensis]